MFVWLNKQGVESDQGFIVQSISRFIIEYRELSKVIKISTEIGMLKNGKACVYVYPDEFEKWNDGTLIDPVKQKEIFQNFKDAMEFQGVEVLTDENQ